MQPHCLHEEIGCFIACACGLEAEKGLWHVHMQTVLDLARGFRVMQLRVHSHASRFNLPCGVLQALPGVPKLRAGVNPATWMLEISTPAAEQRLNLDFAEAYRNSKLYRRVVHGFAYVQSVFLHPMTPPAQLALSLTHGCMAESVAAVWAKSTAKLCFWPTLEEQSSRCELVAENLTKPRKSLVQSSGGSACAQAQ